MFVSGEKLIEFSIRVGTQELIDHPEIVTELFTITKQSELDQNNLPVEISIFDDFQSKLSSIPKRESETGRIDIFNMLPSTQDILGYLAKANISIKHGFPRDSKDLPAICITLSQEEEQPWIGMNGGIGFDLSSDPLNVVVANNDTTYAISILTPNYDETVIWYNIIKYCLMRYRLILEGYGLKSAKPMWADIEPAPDFLQSGIFVYQRTCMFSCVKEETFPAKYLAGISSLTPIVPVPGE